MPLTNDRPVESFHQGSIIPVEGRMKDILVVPRHLPELDGFLTSSYHDLMVAGAGGRTRA